MYQPVSKSFLESRGKCCGHGCKNCPYSPKHCSGNKIRDGLQLRFVRCLDYYDGPLLSLYESGGEYYFVSFELLDENKAVLYLPSKENLKKVLNSEVVTLASAFRSGQVWTIDFDRTEIVNNPVPIPYPHDDARIFDYTLPKIDIGENLDG